MDISTKGTLTKVRGNNDILFCNSLFENWGTYSISEAIRMTLDFSLEENKKLINIANEIARSTMYSLLGRATKKMRAISLNYNNNSIKIEMFFDSTLTDEEEDEMEYAHTEVISDIFPQIFDGGISFVMTVVPPSIGIYDKKGNLGWTYLRKEY